MAFFKRKSAESKIEIKQAPLNEILSKIVDLSTNRDDLEAIKRMNPNVYGVVTEIELKGIVRKLTQLAIEGSKVDGFNAEDVEKLGKQVIREIEVGNKDPEKLRKMFNSATGHTLCFACAQTAEAITNARKQL